MTNLGERFLNAINYTLSGPAIAVNPVEIGQVKYQPGLSSSCAIFSAIGISVCDLILFKGIIEFCIEIWKPYFLLAKKPLFVLYLSTQPRPAKFPQPATVSGTIYPGLIANKTGYVYWRVSLKAL